MKFLSKESTVYALDDFVRLEKAASLVAPKPVHYMTVHRWAMQGLDFNGRRLKLETAKIAGVRYTTPRWLNEFFAAQQNATAPSIRVQQ